MNSDAGLPSSVLNGNPQASGTEVDLQRVFDASPACLLVLAPDVPRFTILAVTDAYLEATKTRRQDVIGKGVFEVFPDNPDDPETKAVDFAKASFARVVESRRSDVMGIRKHDIRVRDSGGGGFVARYWDAVNFPVLGPDGEVTSIIHRVSDVTESMRQKQKSAEQDDVNKALRDSRAAALNLMRDAMTAREEAERATAALRESEERFRLALSNSPVSVAIQDRNLVYQWAYNQRTRRTDEIIGKTDDDLFAPEDVAAITDAKRRVLQSGEEVHVQTWLTSNGKRLCLDLHYEPMHDAAGEITGIGIAVVDITEQKLGEEALRESEGRYRALTENIPDLIVRFDKDMRLVYANAAVTQRTKLPDSALIGRTASEYGAAPTSAAMWESTAREVVNSGESQRIEHTNEWHGVRRTYDTHLIPEKGPDGIVRGVVAFAHDITERKRAEEALLESKAKLQAALASMTDAVFISDTEGHFIEFNDAFATFHRFSNRDECAKTLAEYPEFLEVFMASGELAPLDMWAVPRAMRGEVGTNVEYGLRRKDTGETWVGSYSFGPIRDADGAIAGCVVAGRDITKSKRAEEALRKSEGWLSTTLRSIGDAVLATDAEGRITLLNPVAEALTGWSEAEAMGRNVSEVLVLINESSREPVASPVTACLESGTVVSLANHTLLVRRDGSEVPIDDSGAPIRDADGRLMGAILVFRDITDRKRAEKELHRLNRTLVALRNSNQAILRAQTESEYLSDVCRIVAEDCGHAMVWIGFAEDDEAKTVRPMAFAGFEEGYLDTLNITWADTERGRGPTGTAIRTGKPSMCRNMLTDPSFRPWRDQALKRGYVSSLVLPIKANGKAIGAATIYSSDADSFGDDEVLLLSRLADDLAFGIATIRLREAREKAEIELRESEERYHSLFKGMTEGFALHEIVCDENGVPCDFRFLDINPAFEELTGLKRKDVVGRLHSEVLPDDDPYWLEMYGEVALSGESAHFENYSPALERHYEVFAYRPAEGQFAVVFMDITERRRQADALVQANQAKDEFLAMLGHEIRNPLSAINNAATLIELQTAGQDVVQKPVAIVNRQVQHISRLVEDLMDVSRITHGKLELRKEGVELSGLVKRTAEVAQPQVDAAGCTLTVSTPTAPIWIDGDPARLEQIVGNLLSNAAKYTERGGLITLALRGTAKEAVIEVKDTGTGIAPEMLSKVFDLFVQEPRSRGRSGGGLGIGLTLVKTLVELHEGSVEVESAGLGMGSKFTVRFPARAANDAECGHSGERSGVTPRPLSVLLVEDDVFVAQPLAHILELWGHSVRLVHDGQSAVDEVSREVPDVVLLDMGMPGMDGFEVAQTLRATKGLECLRLIAITGDGSERARRMTREYGFEAHLIKPVNFSVVAELLARGASAGD